MAGIVIDIGNTFDSIEEVIDCFQSLIQRLQELKLNPPTYLHIQIEGGNVIEVKGDG